MKKFILALSVLAGLIGCETSPTGRTQIMLASDTQLDSLGSQAFTELKSKEPIDSNTVTNEYVRCVANALASVLPEKQNWEVVVFKSKQVNAFALPGGKIGVYDGLLPVANTPAQLAAVLGHELSHVIAKHGKERMSEQIATSTVSQLASVFMDKESPRYGLVMAGLGIGAQYGVMLPFSRAQETEADVMGLDFMARAGFDPSQAVTLWENMSKAVSGQPPELLSDHPSNERRIQNLQAKLPEAMATYRAASHKPTCKQ